MDSKMAYPIKTCVVCHEEFELKPGKPGYANRCPDCSADDEKQPTNTGLRGADALGTESERNEARRQAMKNLLYRKDD